MAANLKRYLKVFFLLKKVAVLKAMEYRFNFLGTALVSASYMAGYITLTGAITSKVSNVAGWTFDGMMVLFGFSQLVIYLSWYLFRRSLRAFPRYIRTGEFDYILRLPISPKFMISIQEDDFFFLPQFISLAVVFVYIFQHANPYLPFVFYSFVLVVCSVVFLYGFMLIMAACSFWIVEGDDLQGFVEEVLNLSRYPLSIFPSAVVGFLTIVVPLLLVAYVPASVFLGIVDWKLIGLLLIMTIVTLAISDKVWKAGLRQYSSASS